MAVLFRMAACGTSDSSLHVWVVPSIRTPDGDLDVESVSGFGASFHPVRASLLGHGTPIEASTWEVVQGLSAAIRGPSFEWTVTRRLTFWKVADVETEQALPVACSGVTHHSDVSTEVVQVVGNGALSEILCCGTDC